MPSLKTSLGVPCFMFIFLATNWDESVLYILCGRGSLCFGQFGQNSDNIRTKFGQNSTNSDKIWKKFGQISDKIRQNSDKCPLFRWWRHICRTIVPTLKSILQIVEEMSRWEYENMSEICKRELNSLSLFILGQEPKTLKRKKFNRV